VTHDLLHDLWLHPTTDVAVSAVTVHANRVTVHATTTRAGAPCPSCGTSSGRVHSSYVRRLDDSAAGQRRVVIELRVRRFRCRQPACERATFVEQVQGVTFRYGPRSRRLQAALQRFGLMLAGRAGSRLAEAFAVPSAGPPCSG
jgi:transposase